MSLNNIQLSSQMLASLYADVMIEPGQTPQPKETSFKFLGSNKKNIVVLVSKESIPFLEEKELDFLSSILAACKFSLADVAIVNVHKSASDYHALNSFFNSRYMLLFDVEPHVIDLPFNFPHFQIQNFDGCVYLSAPALSTIEADKAAKGTLWSKLKNLFGL